MWAAGFGGYGSISDDSNAGEVHHSIAGFIVGADIAVSNGLRVGLAGGYTGNDASTTDRSSTASGNMCHLIAYGGWFGDQIDLKAGGDFGWGSADVTRAIGAFGQTDRDRQGSVDRPAICGRWLSVQH